MIGSPEARDCAGDSSSEPMHDVLGIGLVTLGDHLPGSARPPGASLGASPNTSSVSEAGGSGHGGRLGMYPWSRRAQRARRNRVENNSHEF